MFKTSIFEKHIEVNGAKRSEGALESEISREEMWEKRREKQKKNDHKNKK